MLNIPNRLITSILMISLFVGTQTKASDPFCRDLKDLGEVTQSVCVNILPYTLDESKIKQWFAPFKVDAERLIKSALDNVLEYKPQVDLTQFIRVELIQPKPSLTFIQQENCPVVRVIKPEINIYKDRALCGGSPPPLLPKGDICLFNIEKPFYLEIEQVFPRRRLGPVYQMVQDFLNNGNNRAERENLIIRLLRNHQKLNDLEESCLIVGLKCLSERRQKSMITGIQFDNDSNSESTFAYFPIEVLGTILSIAPEKSQIAFSIACKAMLKNAFKINTYKLFYIAKEIRDSYIADSDYDFGDPIYKELCTLRVKT